MVCFPWFAHASISQAQALLSEQSAYVENNKQQDADKLQFSWSFVGTSDFWGHQVVQQTFKRAVSCC